MKKTLLFFLIAGFLTACKKDKSSLKEIALSKIFKNSVLVEEFVYSPQKQMIRINSYDELTGQFDYATGFEYNNEGKLVLENQYSIANKIAAQVIYTWENNGRLRQHEYKSLSGADSGHITNRVKYNYDAAGRVSKQSWVDLVTDQVETSRDLAYYSNGNLKSSEVYYHYNPVPELQWKVEYSPEGNPLPPSLIKFKGYPVNFLLYELVVGEKHSYNYDNGQVTAESNEIFSNRQYNDKGYLLQQTSTLKNILPAGSDKVIQMQYEYVEL